MKRLAFLGSCVLIVATCGGTPAVAPSQAAASPTAVVSTSAGPSSVQGTAEPSATAVPTTISTPAPTPAASATPAATPEASPSTIPGPAADFQPFALQGSGKKVVKFTIAIPDGSAAIASINSAGTKHLVVVSIAADGTHNQTLIDTTGKYVGSVLFDTTTRSVGFDIQASGGWTIVVKPVASARDWATTAILKGTGDDVVEIVPPSTGPIALAVTYGGKKAFVVTSYASAPAVLVNAPGGFKGSASLPVGASLLSIRATGAWTITPG